MTKIFWYILIYGSAMTSLMHPWVGMVIGYLIVILGPQFIWFWAVPSHPFFTVAIGVLAGFLFKVLTGQVDYSRLKTPINFHLLIWFIFILLSYYFGPYSFMSKNYHLGSDRLFAIYQKIFLFYFLAVILIDSRKRFFLLMSVFLISVLYLTYWANMQYLSGIHFLRLAGPRGPHGSAYGDENVFAMVFVMGGPFFYYLGYLLKNKLLRVICWCVIPFTWHAVFLTASRGGLIGIVGTIFIAGLRSPKRFLGLLIIPIFFFIYQWQGGSIMKNRAKTIVNYEQESSAMQRIHAWQAATRMIIKNPFVGVGVGSFVTAFPDYSQYDRREAHNTFFQIAAESGIVAGINWILLLAFMFKTLNKASNYYKNKDYTMFLICESFLVSMFGFTLCAMFLSLHVHEIFFYFCLMVNYFYLALKESSSEELIHKE